MSLQQADNVAISSETRIATTKKNLVDEGLKIEKKAFGGRMGTQPLALDRKCRTTESST